MNSAKILRLVPTLLLATFLAYSAYSMQAGLPGAAEERAELSKGLDTMVEDILSSGADAVGLLKDELRDPFQVSLKAVAPAAAQDAAPAAPDSDPLADIVAELKLDATFLQGRDQIAIIDGRIYSRGQHLRVAADDGKSSSPLVVTSVLSSKVILRGEGKTYVLSYPDQLGKRPDAAPASPMAELDPGGQRALFERLLNSPLGAMGKGLLGNQALTDPSATSGARRKRRSRGAPTSSGAGSGNF